MAHPHWYLPRPWAVRVHAAMGGVDLDPCAAHPELDQVHAATSYLWPAQDGLTLPWSGRVYCNPPYDRRGVRLFTDRILAQEQHCDQLVVLVPLRPSARWWRDLARRAETCIILPKRIAFIDGSAEPKKGTTGRGELCFFAWRVVNLGALGGIAVNNIMAAAEVAERNVQRTLEELLRQEPSDVPRVGT